MNLTYSISEIERSPYGIPSIDGDSIKFVIGKSIEILNTEAMQSHVSTFNSSIKTSNASIFRNLFTR